MINITFTPVRDSFMQVLQKLFDLGPDFTDKILINQIRDFAKELNDMADKEEAKLKGNQ